MLPKGFKVRVEQLYFNMFMKIKVLIGNAKSRDSRVVPTVKNTKVHNGFAKFHEFSLIEARGQAISRFHGCTYGVV